jgi:hypothetical protein
MKTLKDRDVWQGMVLADGCLSSGCKCTLLRISLHHNFKTEQCNPSYETLANGTGVTLAAIPKHLKQGEERGYLRRNSTQGRHSNSYEFLFPGTATTTNADRGLTANGRIGSTTNKRTGIKTDNPIPASRPTAYFGESEPPTAIHTNKEIIQNKEKNNEEIDLFPSMSLVAVEPQSPNVFERFYAAYPRKKAPRDAEVALNQVLKKKLATEEQIMAGVVRLTEHFSRRPKADRIYIPYPAKWLRDGAWDDDLDEPRSRSGSRQTEEMEASVSVLQRWGRQ